MAADAAGDLGDLGLIRANAYRAIGDLRRAVQGARAQERRRGARFLDLIDAALDALRDRVYEAEKMAESAQDERERRAAARFARRINTDLRFLHEAAPWVESARQGSLGLGLVYFVDEMVAGLLKDQADVVVSPTAAYMYSTVYNIPKWIENALHVPTPEGPIAIVVAYPVHELDSLYLHLLIAHELGHSVVDPAMLVARVAAKDPDTEVVTQALAEAATVYGASHNTSAKEAQVRAATMLRDWVTELLCDALGLAFIGPSFVFTFAAFSTPFEQKAHESHPPFGLRTEALMSQLDIAGWRGTASSVAPTTFKAIDAARGVAADPEHPYFEHLIAAARHLIPTIVETAREHVGDAVFEYDEAHVTKLTELLDEGVLPAQVDEQPARRRSIILAGWIHTFRRPEITDEPASLAKITADREHQRFLTKALEMSNVLETWDALS